MKKSDPPVLFVLFLVFFTASFSGAVTLLDSGSSWRIHNTLEPPVVQAAKGVEFYEEGVRWLDKGSVSAPAGWESRGFDDGNWVRGAIQKVCYTPYLREVCLRGKFKVERPRSVNGLSVSLEFHGGAIVYLNGKEVARKYLPTGLLTEKSLAEAYPLEVFVKEDGDLLASQGAYLSKGRAGCPSQEDSRRMGLRVRKMKSVEIDKKFLRKGVNVLAVKLIRAPYNSIVLEESAPGRERHNRFDWNSCELQQVELKTTSREGLVLHNGTSDEMTVWVADVLEGDTDLDRGDPIEEPSSVRITGARNGSFSGKIVARAPHGFQKLDVKVSALKGKEGTISPASVQLRYGAAWGTELGLTRTDDPFQIPFRKRSRPKLLGMLTQEVPDAPVVPIWITVNIPKDLAAGLYSGTVTVRTKDQKKVCIPIKVDVADWTLPDAQDYRTWVELVQSPDTLSVEYEEPLWSDRHFEMIAESFDLIKHTGSRIVYVPLIAHSNLGNAESMVRWIKNGNSYVYDFSVMDRYLDTALEHLGVPKVVVLQVWDVYMSQANEKRFEDFNRLGAPKVTLLNPSSGKTENITLPPLSDVKSKVLWERLFKEVMQHLEGRGLGQSAMIGMFPDLAPSSADVRFFEKAAPGLPWVAQGHQLWPDIYGAKVGYQSCVWGGYRFADGARQTNQKKAPVVESLHGWNRSQLATVFERNISIDTYPGSRWRFFAETGITSELRGVGRIGADYWKPIKDKRGRRRGWVHDRFSEGSWAGNRMNLVLCNPVLAPGSDGPKATNRLLAFGEGVQECEARILIEEALLDKKLRLKLGDDLVARCEKVLDDRLLIMWKSLSNLTSKGRRFFGATSWRWTPGIPGHHFFVGSNWQARSKELFLLAGEVEKKVTGK